MRKLLILAVLVAGCSSPGSDGGTPYQTEYGGSPAVYSLIASMTNCGALQDEFDVAAANNDAATPGTPQHRQTTGYMRAADDRMRAVGCY